MKKSLARVLSLVLVLVMMLGVMPIASASTPAASLAVVGGKTSYENGEDVVMILTAPTGFTFAPNSVIGSYNAQYVIGADGKTATYTYPASDSQSEWALSAAYTLIPEGGGENVSGTSN